MLFYVLLQSQIITNQGVQFDVQISVAKKGQKRIAQGKAQRPPGLFHVVDGRPAKGKSIDNGRTDNAFALTARRANNPLHPGCRYALPWAMCFCANSACWSMCFLRASSLSKSGTVPFGYNKLDTLLLYSKVYFVELTLMTYSKINLCFADTLLLLNALFLRYFRPALVMF